MATKPQKWVSRAPTRMDLAGGTIDIWPLYLFLNQPRTVNLAINLAAETTLTLEPESTDPGILLRSLDQSHEFSLKWDEIENKDAPPALTLHLKLLRYFALKAGYAKHRDARLALETRALSPAGAGLGGSSTLSVSIIGALATCFRGQIHTDAQGEHFIEIVRDVETTVIRVPAGLQDYYGAMYGGLQSLRWGAARHDREALPQSALVELKKRLVLFYSGQSRNSGINNWALFKDFIDGKSQVRERFQKISDAALALEQAIRAADWKAAGQAIFEEWSVRRTLASEISTPEIDRAWELARKEGATAFKICGAGGGGCFFVYLPDEDPELRSRIQNKIGEIQGIRHLPFEPSAEGLSVRTA